MAHFSHDAVGHLSGLLGGTAPGSRRHNHPGSDAALYLSDDGCGSLCVPVGDALGRLDHRRYHVGSVRDSRRGDYRSNDFGRSRDGQERRGRTSIGGGAHELAHRRVDWRFCPGSGDPRRAPAGSFIRRAGTVHACHCRHCLYLLVERPGGTGPVARNSRRAFGTPVRARGPRPSGGSSALHLRPALSMERARLGPGPGGRIRHSRDH